MTHPFELTIARTDGAANICLEASAGVTAFVLAGRYFAARSTRKAGAALKALQAHGDLLQGPRGGADPGEDVDAGAVVGDHARDATCPALDPLQARWSAWSASVSVWPGVHGQGGMHGGHDGRRPADRACGPGLRTGLGTRCPSTTTTPGPDGPGPDGPDARPGPGR
ncbi:hypothetical protein BU52_25945 [Streptomyces toyocaensis]|uniref:Uncharacterized protein n=1 Tax=Streptomyces toyocaensis TaxID=55952 RepID=A0A081XL30_STRTO|nr:hypothetical protein BU52_25945 [Streptomyces toyocaensis]